MSFDWAKIEIPEWHALPFCKAFRMCRYWPGPQLLEFVQHFQFKDHEELYFGVPKEVFELILAAGPFINTVLDHHLALSAKMKATRQNPYSVLSIAELTFSLPGRDAPTPVSPRLSDGEPPQDTKG